MTVNTTNITSGPYTGTGVSDQFSYTFRVEDKTQLAVYETDDVGSQTLLLVDTDYTVAGIGVDAGGIITRVAGNLPTGYVWFIRSDYKQTQLTAFPSQGPFFPETHEAVMDKLTFLIQQLQDGENRSFRLDDSIDIDGVFTIADVALARAGKFLSFDTSGNLQITAGQQMLTGDLIFDNVALAKAQSNAVGLTIDTRGRSSAGDGGGARYIVQTPAQFGGTPDEFGDHTDAGGNILVLQVSGTVNVLKYGVVGDGVTDNSAAYQAAVDSTLELFTPPGDFLFLSEVILNNQGQRIMGSGWGSVAGGSTSRMLTTTDVKTFKATATFTHIEGFFFDNTAATMSQPHVHYAGDAFSSMSLCRFNTIENFTALGGGILMDDGAGGIGGSVGVIDRINISHGTLTVKRSDVHVTNSWIWANSRPFGVRASGAIGNLVLETCDFLPPQTLVAARKAAVYLDGAVSAPRLLDCNLDGNSSLSTGTGLLAENGVLNLLVSGGYSFGHNEDSIIIDSCINPIVDGTQFKNNNLAEDGSTDITLQDTFGQPLEKPLVQGCGFTQTAALAGTAGPAVKLVATTARSGVRIVDNSIHQPGSGGGYTDIEIDLEDGAFANSLAGSLAGNRGSRTHYEISGTTAFVNTDTFKTISYGVTMAYAPRVDQMSVQTASTGAPPAIRYNSAPLPSTTSAGIGLHGTFGSGTFHWGASL